MKKSIIISIKPEWVEKILNGEKTIEIRKSMPKYDLPIDVYIYCCQSNNGSLNYFGKEEGYHYMPYEIGFWSKKDAEEDDNLCGKIVAKFTLNKVEEFDGIDVLMLEDLRMMLYGSCLSTKQAKEYSGGANIFAWHIDNLKVFDEPMELSEFYKNNWEDLIDKRDCKSCKYKDYDLQEHQMICAIDYDGQKCPKLRVNKAPQSWCYAYKEE